MSMVGEMAHLANGKQVVPMENMLGAKGNSGASDSGQREVVSGSK